ncbi:MAG: restriction endonuclease subunit S [Chitinivibrionia bacterium]|nr:restriction endonuclease subunit S [Chitinivibrionia bacterium]
MLGTLDDKIELNRRTNETLETLARALFKSWFVDFDTVRAKAEGRQPVGMDADTAKLFPSEFVESELGEIPKGWRAVSLSEAAELNPVRRLERGACAPYVEMSSLPTSGHRPSEWPLREPGSGARFQNGDTLFARITPCLENGKTGYVDFLEKDAVGWGSTEYIVIRPRPPLPTEWGYLCARDEAFRNFAVQKMEGTTGRQRVSADSAGRYLVVVPPVVVANLFTQVVTGLFRRMASGDDENRTLTELRDTLLPKLLSAEIRVKDAERFVEGTV